MLQVAIRLPSEVEPLAKSLTAIDARDRPQETVGADLEPDFCVAQGVVPLLGLRDSLHFLSVVLSPLTPRPQFHKTGAVAIGHWTLPPLHGRGSAWPQDLSSNEALCVRT